MSLLFKVGATSAEGGRRAELVLPHGVVQTPVFMPVGTAATVKAVPQNVLEEIGEIDERTAKPRAGRDHFGEYVSLVSAAGA